LLSHEKRESQVHAMLYTIYQRLVRRNILTDAALRSLIRESNGSPRTAEELMTARGIPKHELLHCLTETFGCPAVEYDEAVVVAQQVLRRVDAERLKKALWFPLSLGADRAEVIAGNPLDPSLAADVKRSLGVTNVEFLAALPSDLVRIIEHNQDLNPSFPAAAGRTPLAKVRTFLADRRSLFACNRTSLAQARTGLAFQRTGVSFITIALVLYRISGFGWLAPLQAGLLAAGIVMAVDGLRWYLPARSIASRQPACRLTDGERGSSVLTATWDDDAPQFDRSDQVDGAAGLRQGWQDLSPVMRRRFLAGDRTDYAEERTLLGCLRTRMARARTGLAFSRTGIALVGLGIALLRIERFRTSFWTWFDGALILLGIAKIGEGLLWYLPGRRAGREGFASIRRTGGQPTIWDSLFPPAHQRPEAAAGSSCRLPVSASQSPGIWATTGLALERTVLAERRNVMARLRTIMARSRTGLAFIRTGMSVSAIGAGLLATFGTSSFAWAAFYAVLTAAGALFIADGLYWHLPAERMRREFPYCYCDVEITVPDYGRPSRTWATAVFSHDDL
jgi:uncharacterized membrane protein YidH (DUF202 family)